MRKERNGKFGTLVALFLRSIRSFLPSGNNLGCFIVSGKGT